MRTPLKLPFALRNDTLIHISEVHAGRRLDCVCPECKQPLIARKGRIKQHHFAHDAGSQCNLESTLHWIGKTLIYSGIQAALKDNKPISLRWECSECYGKHEGNLLKQAATAKLEYDLGAARPDVLLVDSQDKPIAAIEVIVGHPPEDAALSFYQQAGIVVVEVKLETYEVLDALRDLRELNASAVSICIRPKCTNCGGPVSQKTLHVVDGECYRCGAPMKISLVDAEGYWYGPEMFSKHEIEVAEKRGCILREQYSKTLQERYVANTCRTCGAFAGKNHLHEFYNRAGERTGVFTGHFCPKCEKHFEGCARRDMCRPQPLLDCSPCHTT